MLVDAYLDIETTGLSCEYAGITVIGMYMVNGAEARMVQLVGWTRLSCIANTRFTGSVIS